MLPPPGTPVVPLYTGKYLRLVAQGTWEYADRSRSSGAVNIVAITPDESLIIVEQYRVPMQRPAIELPAGLVGDTPGEEDEAQLLAAQRELLEETGYTAESWQWLTTGPTTPGMATEEIATFLAMNLTRVHAGGGVDSEDIIVHEIPLAKLPDWLLEQHQAGKAIDTKVYAGLYFALRALQKLPARGSSSC